MRVNTTYIAGLYDVQLLVSHYRGQLMTRTGMARRFEIRQDTKNLKSITAGHKKIDGPFLNA